MLWTKALETGQWSSCDCPLDIFEAAWEDRKKRLQFRDVPKVAGGYEIQQRCVINKRTFGRVFVDDLVQWVIKQGEVITIFENNGTAHFYLEN